MPTIPTDPDFAAALAALPRGANGAMMDLTDIPAQRAAFETVAASMPVPPLPDGVTVITVNASRDDGSALAVHLYRPDAVHAPAPVLLWFHAGGQVFVSGRHDDAYYGSLAVSISAVVAVVDYRLAPETPAPGAAQDGFLAYTTLIERADDLGIDPAAIGLAGASGGGAPAAATALMIRDRGVQAPRLLSLSYAMLDDRDQTLSTQQITDLGVWDRRENRLAWRAVLGSRVGSPALEPYSAPGRTTDFAGLPPAFIAAAGLDVFRDEDIAFAIGLIAAGVPVDLHVYSQAFHAFDRFAPAARTTEQFESAWHAFLDQRLHAGSPAVVRASTATAPDAGQRR